MSLSSRLSPQSRGSSPLELNINVLNREDELAKEVERILSMSFQQAGSFIANTSVTAYRRVHEIVTSALDRLIGSVEQDPAILVDLSKALILIKYQVVRNQISGTLANYVGNVIKSVIDVVRTNWEEAKRIARNARTLLDALVVLVQDYSKHHREKE